MVHIKKIKNKKIINFIIPLQFDVAKITLPTCFLDYYLDFWSRFLIFQGLYPLKDYIQGLEATLEAVSNRVQSLEEVVLLLRQTTDIDPDPVIHRVRWATSEVGEYFNTSVFS